MTAPAAVRECPAPASPAQTPPAANFSTWLQRRGVAAKILALSAGVLALTASSYASIPLAPVPITLQTLAVTLAGALFGWRLGGLTILAWLALGALGLPVFSGGTGGFARFLGPTGGYLLAFPVAGALTGWLAGRCANGRRTASLFTMFAIFLAGNALCLILGGIWLAAMSSTQKALAVGGLPLVPGATFKSLLGAALLGIADIVVQKMTRQ